METDAITAPYALRLAIPQDAKAFADITAADILARRVDMREVVAAKKATNPTVLTFVVEKDGVPVVFAPIYLVAQLAHMGFAPESSYSDRKEAMKALLNGVSAFMAENGVMELGALCPEGHPVKAWGIANGYTADDRVYLSYKTKAVALEPAQKADVNV